jgi:hypothetical protein
MKNAMLFTLIVSLPVFSGFKKDSVAYEQVAFDYFASEILRSEFSNISTIEFNGETEHTYSALGKYKFCLKPEKKLQSLVEDAAKGRLEKTKQISHEKIKSISIMSIKSNSGNPKVYVYPAIRVADNFYVFVSLKRPKEPTAKYVFELNPSGEITRNCRME